MLGRANIDELKYVGGMPLEELNNITIIIRKLENAIEEVRTRINIAQGLFRALFNCDMLVLIDRNTVHIAAERNRSKHNLYAYKYEDKTFAPQDILKEAIYELGFNEKDTFYLGFDKNLINMPNKLRAERLIRIAEEYVETEIQRYKNTHNLIKINPIFGPANYVLDNNLAFIIMPFRDDLTEIYEKIIRPTVEEKLVCRRGDDYKTNKMIMQDIWKAICEAKLIIADVTGFNPNVMYELGIAHTLGKEVIMIYQKNQGTETKFPFDLHGIRRIEYENTVTAAKNLENDLRKTIENILKPQVIIDS